MKFTPRTVVLPAGLMVLMVVGCQTYRRQPMPISSYPGMYHSQPVIMSQGAMPPGAVYGQPGPVYGQPGVPVHGMGPATIGSAQMGQPTLGAPQDLGPGSTFPADPRGTPTYNPPGTNQNYDPPGFVPGGQPSTPGGTTNREVPTYPDPGPSTDTFPPASNGFPSSNSGGDRPVPNYPDQSQPFDSDPEPFTPDSRAPRGNNNPPPREFPSGSAGGNDEPVPFGNGEPFEEDANPPPFGTDARPLSPSVPLDGSGSGGLRQVAHEQPQSFGGQSNFEGGETASFEQPIPFEGNNAASNGQPEARPNPYGYDPQNYTWLRGIVDYDPSDGSWYIIYDLTPKAGDQFGGGMTLIGEGLNVLKNNQVVLVQGLVDFNNRDRTGKACYHVKHLAVLRARAR